MWRFLVAIGVFAIAMVFLVTGLSFKVLAGPRTTTESIPLKNTDAVSYVVLDSSVVTAKPGLQTVTASGNAVNFVAYGRTTDVLSWIGSSPYVDVSRDAKSGKVSTTVVSPRAPEDSTTGSVEQTIVNPAGSDMWLEEAVGKKVPALLSMKLPADMSIIVAGDGTGTIPSEIAVSWPLPQPTFLWLGDDQLLLVGGGVALIGIALYVHAISVHRRQQGPRRKTPRPPKPRKISRGRHDGIQAPQTRGRRAATRRLSMIAVPLAVVSSLSLVSCASPYQTGGTEPTPTPTSTSDNGVDLPPASVTESQFTVIMNHTLITAKAADDGLDGNIAEQRFAGPALASRRSNYAVRKADASLPAVASLPSTPVALFLPEATTTWPRQVLAVFQPEVAKGKDTDKAKETAPTLALVMQQNSPRDNYKILYQVNLQPNQQVPEVAVSDVGTLEIPADSKLLMLPPNQVAAAYADVLAHGDDSQFASLFDKDSDTLRVALAAERTQQNADNVSVTYEDRAGDGPAIAMATVSSGAIVAVTVDEIGTFAPQGGRSLKLTGALKALAGLELSPVAMLATYQYQLLIYVPPLGANDTIQLLGFTESLVKVSQG